MMKLFSTIITLLISLYIVQASDRKMLNLLRTGTTERELQTCPNVWQYAPYGTCQNCPNGQVASTDYKSCKYCDSGSVRGNAAGNEASGCVNVVTTNPSPCPNAWQYAQYGVCQICPNGQVGNNVKTGCEYCVAGMVRGNADGSDMGTPGGCVNVTTASPSPCPNAWQYAQYGVCQKCPAGQVGNPIKTGCEYCPAGMVRGNANGNDVSEPGGCVNVTTASPSPCPNASQYAQYGVCQKCPSGQVGNAIKSGCEYCKAGTVRNDENNTDLGECLSAAVYCPKPWQYGQYGSCQNCPNGQNSNSKKTGCEYCPPGSIRGDVAGASLAACTGVCSRWQHAQYGACQNCPTGQVGGSGNVGCQYCAPGTVRGGDGKATSGCVDATGPCPAPYQYGQYGQCQTCPTGQVSNDLKTGCAYCPAGSARGIDGKANTGCDPGSSICPLPYQYAQYGQCQTCPTGQVPTEDKKGCAYCLAGTVRGFDGTASSGCVNATGTCLAAYQYGQYGQCQTCPTGQISNGLKTGCVYCPAGTVRGMTGKELSDCVSAANVCTGLRQYGQYGACQTCPSNQVANDNKDGCKYP